MTARPQTAVILAAGMGTRLRDVFSERPKGFVEIGGESLIARSARILRERGIRRIVIVAGHLGEAYRDFAAGEPGIEVVENEAYADTGSMASLARALEVVDEDFLLLESDLFFEERAIDAMLEFDAADVLLVSGPTGATDEVWVEAQEGRLRRLSKQRDELDRISGELVGVLRVSRELARGMADAFAAFVSRHGHGRMAYETDALVEAARERPVAICLIADLLWGEVDYEAHYRRVRDVVWPRMLERSARLGSAGRPWPVRRKVLLNPGPATTTQSVKDALVIPDVCPRERAFCELYAGVRQRLARLAGDPDEIAAIPIVGTGTTALEAVLVSLIPPDAMLLVVDNGDYGARLAAIARAHEIPHRVFDAGFGQAIDLKRLERAMLYGGAPATHLFVVHHETSSGLLSPLDEIAELARRHAVELFVDAMSSFACLPIRVGAAGGIGALVTSSNKCIQGMAGLGIVIASRRVLDAARGTRRRCFALDLVAEHDHLEKTGQSRFTIPPQIVSALHQALCELEQEGISGRRARYRESMRVLARGLRELGFEPLLDEALQSHILLAVREPKEQWYDFDRLHDAMQAEDFTIYPGKPGAEPSFRLAVLGAIDASDIERFLAALGRHLEQVRG